MQVTIQGKKQVRQVELGDIFVNEREGQVYFFAKVGGNRHALINMSGKTYYRVFDSFEQAQADAKDYVNQGVFTHYSKNDFELVLKTKEA